MAAGRAAVPKTCWVSLSSSRNGSVRINIISHSFDNVVVALFSLLARLNLWWRV
jgi:hypothetical protein